MRITQAENESIIIEGHYGISLRIKDSDNRNEVIITEFDGGFELIYGNKLYHLTNDKIECLEITV